MVHEGTSAFPNGSSCLKLLIRSDQLALGTVAKVRIRQVSMCIGSPRMTEGTAVRVNGTRGAGAGNGGPGTPRQRT